MSLNQELEQKKGIIDDLEQSKAGLNAKIVQMETDLHKEKENNNAKQHEIEMLKEEQSKNKRNESYNAEK